MWEFLMKIFSEREGDVTVVVLDEQDPDGSATFRLQAKEVIKLVLLVTVISVAITIFMFFATPLGSLYQHQQDEALRSSVIEISDRVAALQDSLEARDMQLHDLREVLRVSRDTTYDVRYGEDIFAGGRSPGGGQRIPVVNAYEMLSQGEIAMSRRMNRLPDFPANFPLQGTLSQGFSSEDGHYGIDLAARPGTEFRALADGTVVSASWTVSYGYVLQVQHAGGIVSVYKHGARLSKEKGDFVLKGDILGTIGDRGVLSSGSHLHLEIWKNGVPQNPIMYLIN